jgi:hypothetical protein
MNPEYIRQLENLWDFVSDMVEGCRLTREDISDDYDALVCQMERLNELSPEPSEVPRVLVYIEGGIADYTADDGIDVEIFDMDIYKNDPKSVARLPASFRDLASLFRAPVEE